MHARTLALCESLNFREWSGYYAVSAYETHHEHEYTAIRNAAALIDVSPLFKYLVSGPDAVRLVDRVITRDAHAMAVGQVYYTPWCDERGKVIDDGTVTRVAEQTFRWTAADPSLRWFTQNAGGLNVRIEDISERTAALALQGPTSAGVLSAVADADVRSLKYFRMTRGTIAGVPVEISRTGYTGDLGYEIWMPWDRAIDVWDALMTRWTAIRHPPRRHAGARRRACRSRAAADRRRFPRQPEGAHRIAEILAVRDGARPPGSPRQGTVRRPRGARRRTPTSRRIVGLDIGWPAIERLYDALGMAPQVPATASRVAVPVYDRDRQIGRATTTTWSPVLKKLIALATLDEPYASEGTAVEFEMTVEAVRHRVPAVVAKTPFFNPARKTATPPPLT